MLKSWAPPALVALALPCLKPSGASAQISPSTWYTVVANLSTD